MLSFSTSGTILFQVIEQRKDFRNPSIYEKLVQFCAINELGTNYPAEIYDPLMWGKESFYEELAKVQKAEMDRREKERKEKTKVSVINSSVWFKQFLFLSFKFEYVLIEAFNLAG